MGYIEREAFLEQERKRYCEDCSRRQGMKNGKYKTIYKIGEAPCRACEIYDAMNDVEDFPAADVRPVVRGQWEVDGYHIRCSICGEYMCIKDREGAEIPRKYCPNCGADMREVNNG